MLISEISVPEALRKSRPTPAHEGLPDSLAHTLKVSDWPAVTAKVPERFTPPCAVPMRAALVPECASATMLTGPLVDQPDRSLSKPLLLMRPQVCAMAGDAAARQSRAAKEIHFFVSMGTSLMQRPAAAAEDTRANCARPSELPDGAANRAAEAPLEPPNGNPRGVRPCGPDPV